MPTRKVGLGAAAGAATVVGIWIAGRYGVAVPGEVGSAITLLIYFLSSYLVADPE